MIVKAYKCEGCGADRKETNHWFCIRQTPKTVVLCKWEDAGRNLNSSKTKHFCGRNCAIKYISELMGE